MPAVPEDDDERERGQEVDQREEAGAQLRRGERPIEHGVGSASRRSAWRRSAPKPLIARIPATLSSTTPESSPSLCCSSNVTGSIRCEKRCAAKLRIGSVPSASTASSRLFDTITATTPARMKMLAIVSGRITSIWLICSRSVLARDIS